MCWSLRVSAGSWAVVMVLGTVLLRRGWHNDRWLAGLLMFVGQVQLLEALLWLDQGCAGLNQAASRALLALIAAEPLAHALIALACTPAKQRTAVQRALPAVAAAFAAAFAAKGAAGAESWCCLPCDGGACGRHLKWAWADFLQVTPAWHAAFFALLAAPLLTMRPPRFAAASFAYALASFAAAYALFQPWAVFESMWCWLAVGGFCVPLALGRPPARPAAAGARAQRR